MYALRISRETVMVSDSIKDSSFLSGSSNSGDLAKKKRANWSWRMKQWKHEARRRQWILHLKKGRVGEEENGNAAAKSLSEKKLDGTVDEEIDDSLSEKNIESDADSSASSSPTSVLPSKGRPRSKIGDCFRCTEKIGDEEEGDEVYGDALDNFEGFSDALSYFESESKSPSPETTNAGEKSPRTSQRNFFADIAIHGERSGLLEITRAEQESPKTSRRKSSPKKSEEDAPCPICCEDMDVTDLSFLPCPCGFKLCLFCHKKIVDTDGRCPNCRKEYRTSGDSGEMGFEQRGRGILLVSPSVRGLDRA